MQKNPFDHLRLMKRTNVMLEINKNYKILLNWLLKMVRISIPYPIYTNIQSDIRDDSIAFYTAKYFMQSNWIACSNRCLLSLTPRYIYILYIKFIDFYRSGNLSDIQRTSYTSDWPIFRLFVPLPEPDTEKKNKKCFAALPQK